MAVNVTDSSFRNGGTHNDLYLDLEKFAAMCHNLCCEVARNPGTLSEARVDLMLEIARRYAGMLQAESGPKKYNNTETLLKIFTVLHSLKKMCQSVSQLTGKMTPSVQEAPSPKQRERDDSGVASLSDCSLSENQAASESEQVEHAIRDAGTPTSTNKVVAPPLPNGCHLSLPHESQSKNERNVVGRDLSAQLIALVSETPYLYDKSDIRYTYSKLKLERWNEIEMQLGIPGQAAKKWSRLRDRYKRFYNIMRCAQAQNKEFKSKWKWFDLLHSMLLKHYSSTDCLRGNTPKGRMGKNNTLKIGNPETNITKADLPQTACLERDILEGDRPLSGIVETDDSRIPPIDVDTDMESDIEPGLYEGEIITPNLEADASQCEVLAQPVNSEVNVSVSYCGDTDQVMSSNADAVFPKQHNLGMKRTHFGELSSVKKQKKSSSPAERHYSDLEISIYLALKNNLKDDKEIEEYTRNYVMQQVGASSMRRQM